MKLVKWLIIASLAQCKSSFVLVNRYNHGIKVARSCAKLRFQWKLVNSLSNFE